MTPNLALGSAQFGMAYGVANMIGRPDTQTVADILAYAQANGVDMIDTAIAYGEAEAVLGQIGIKGWRVVTKLPPVPENETDIAGWVEAQTTGSLSRLGISHVHGLLLHSPAQMSSPRAAIIARALESITEKGMARKVGVSIQRPEQDLTALFDYMQPSLIQAPCNLLDQSLIRQGWAAKLHALGCEVHTRSTFLQGLLLMPTDQHPPWTVRFQTYWQVWDAWRARHSLPASDACLRFLNSCPDIDHIIVGVQSVAQLKDLLEIPATPLPDLPDWPRPVHEDLITPSRWPVT